MPFSEITGTEAIGATEHSLTTDTTGPDADTTQAVVQAYVDLSDMIAGDVVRIRVYEKARSGDTQRAVSEFYLAGPQAQPLWVSDALNLNHGWDFTVTAISGTVTVNWSIRMVTE